MNILFVLTYYRPHWTGLTKYAALLAEGLAKKDHNVEVLCSRHNKDLPLRQEINQVKVFRLPYLFRFLRSVVMPGFPVELWKRIKKNEVIVAYLPLQEALLVAIFCKLQNRKLFLVHNGDLVLPRDGNFLNRLVEKIYFWSTFLSIRLSKKVIVQTEDYSNYSVLLSKLKDKWSVILPLFKVPEITNDDVDEFKNKYLLKRKKLIGFSGRFVEEKGIEFLLESIPQVIKEIPNAHFVLAGDYKIQYEKYWDRISGLIEKSKKHLTLLGLINDQRELFAFYKSLDVYVQPSVTDCFPSSQIEAMLSGVPSVCTDIPGARWPVGVSKMGKIVKAKNAKALAEGIVKVIKERNNYSNKIDKVKEIFDYQKTLLNYERLFREN